MLVLSRKVHEAIIIGDGIEVVVTEIRNGRVKLGVTAPRNAKVLRRELEPRAVEDLTLVNVSKLASESNHPKA